MKIKVEVLAYLVIAFLLLTSSQSQFSIAMGTVNDDMKIIRHPKPNPDSVNRFLLATWEPGTKLNDNMRKVPSAPNPKGNRYPPSKP